MPIRPAVRLPREDPIAATIDPRTAPACFGVACPYHGRCQRYAAVADSAADPRTIDTCRVGDRFPLFLACVAAPAAAAA